MSNTSSNKTLWAGYMEKEATELFRFYNAETYKPGSKKNKMIEMFRKFVNQYYRYNNDGDRINNRSMTSWLKVTEVKHPNDAWLYTDFKRDGNKVLEEVGVRLLGLAYTELALVK